MRRLAACAFVVVILGCPAPRDDAARAATPASDSGPGTTAANGPSGSASEIVARTLCDHYWKFTSTSARPYDSLEACVAAETKPRSCGVEQAQACAAFAGPLRPGEAGTGLVGNADCAACLQPSAAADPYAEQRAALERATLTVHSATVHSGAWPADLASERTKTTVLVKVDVSLSGYGYRIDPDDFLLVIASSGTAPEAVGSGPYAERLTSAGKPVAWDDPTVVDDPDLRMVAFFPMASTHRGKPLAVGYRDKVSASFELR